MGKIKVTSCEIEGLVVIEPTVFGDSRGYFMETYNLNDMHEAGLDMVFVQDNQSMSRRGVLRGLHYQKQYPQGKLVRVISGEVFDVAVDLRHGSATYGKWHGDPNDEGGIRWNDPDIGVVWPLFQDVPVLLSEKDQVQPFLKELNQEKE